MRIKSRELLAVGVFGTSSLGDRIEMLLKRGREFSPRVSPSRVALSTVVLLMLVVAGSRAPRWIAFAQQTDRPSFEVAVIKPSNGGPRTMRADPLGIHYTGVTLMECIAEAYQVRYSQISGVQLIPDKFDIEAKAAEAITRDGSRLMLQWLLADRFKLRLHRESKTLPMYRLMAGKSGPKLRKSRTEGEGIIVKVPNGFEFRNMTMHLFSAILSGRLDRPVLDQTGIEGRFDFTLALDFPVPPDPENKMATSDWTSSSIFTDIPNELGLKLEPDKGPVDFLFIDHVEKRSEN